MGVSSSTLLSVNTKSFKQSDGAPSFGCLIGDRGNSEDGSSISSDGVPPSLTDVACRDASESSFNQNLYEVKIEEASSNTLNFEEISPDHGGIQNIIYGGYHAATDSYQSLPAKNFFNQTVEAFSKRKYLIPEESVFKSTNVIGKELTSLVSVKGFGEALDDEEADLQYPPSITTSSFGNWQKVDLIGRGSFATIYEGINDQGYFFAVKEVSLLHQDRQGKESIAQLEQEISLLSKFHHDNIVRYLGTDTGDDKLYIFLELVAKGSLEKLYQKYELWDSQVSIYTRQILSGLSYLHQQSVVHRDIKCANILVDVSGTVKLADFGLAMATALNDIKSCKGTAYWMAPEVVNNRAYNGYGVAADIWSLGCTVLEMLTRKRPYYPLEVMQALFRIGKGEPPPIPSTISTEARDFILKCLQANQKDRPTAAQLLEHPFLATSASHMPLLLL